MSNIVTRTLMKFCRQKGERRTLMLCLAFHADDDGLCWPSQATLAEEASLSERGVQKMIDRLIAEGEIELVQAGGGRGKPAQYRLSRYTGKGEPIVPPLAEKGRTAYSGNTDTERANVETIKGELGDGKGEPKRIKGEHYVPPNSEYQENSSVNSSGTQNTKDDWIVKAKAMDCYRGVNVTEEFQKAQAYYADEPPGLTRRLFFSWLNRAQKTPIAGPKQPSAYKLKPAHIPGKYEGPTMEELMEKRFTEGRQ